eukprot:COSAG01_NODE_10_length_42970_cov_93.010007_31_plen_87_part_00
MVARWLQHMAAQLSRVIWPAAGGGGGGGGLRQVLRPPSYDHTEMPPNVGGCRDGAGCEEEYHVLSMRVLTPLDAENEAHLDEVLRR